MVDGVFPGEARYIVMRITMLWRVGLLLLACGAHGATVSVFAAASLTDCLKVIAQSYAAKHPDDVQFNFAASSVLARQIEEGAPADIFFSADEAKMNALEGKGLIDKSTRRDLLSNTLVIVVPADSKAAVTSAADLASDRIERIAVGDTKAVPAGIYAKEYLKKLGLWEKIKPKTIPMANVRAALAAVESGDADAGIVYKTDAAITKKARVAFAVPKEEGPAIVYPVALVNDSKQPTAARAFLNYLESKSAAATFQKFGFIVEAAKP